MPAAGMVPARRRGRKRRRYRRDFVPSAGALRRPGPAGRASTLRRPRPDQAGRGVGPSTPAPRRHGASSAAPGTGRPARSRCRCSDLRHSPAVVSGYARRSASFIPGEETYDEPTVTPSTAPVGRDLPAARHRAHDPRPRRRDATGPRRRQQDLPRQRLPALERRHGRLRQLPIVATGNGSVMNASTITTHQVSCPVVRDTTTNTNGTFADVWSTATTAATTA